MIKNKYLLKLLIFLLILTGIFSFIFYLLQEEPEIPTIVLPKEDVVEIPSDKLHDIKKQESERGQISMNTVSTNSSQKPILSDNSVVSTDRFTYKEGFYYESLSPAIIERIKGISFKDNDVIFYEDLSYISVLYVDFNNDTQVGEIISNKLVANDLVEIFHKLYIAEYQIDKIKLIDEYLADDDLSCMDNNSSSFNYRTVGGTTKLSKHGLGLAIDINPVYNPYVTYPQGNIRITPPGSEIYEDRSKDFPHKIDANDLCYQLFTEYGWTWGGNWKNIKDYQHFQKELD